MNEFEENIPKTVTDVTGAVLTPGNPEKCQGNGEHKDFECCCDECDWFLLCFSEYYSL
ncbi:MAG: hypothetical protein KBT46_09430 [Ruminococcus sp.]|nr:hypothetical protein [Candidatus Copronaster equi]